MFVTQYSYLNDKDTSMKRYFSLLLLFFYATVSHAANPLKTVVSAGYTYDDNITRAELSRDIEKDNILSVDASTIYKQVLNEISYLSFKGTFAVNQYQDFSKLSNTRLGIHASYNLRLSPGYTAIRYFARLAYELRIYKSDQRDGSATEIELGLSKRLTDLLALRAGFIREDIDADESIGVFDIDNNRFYLDLNYKLDTKNNLYVTIAYVDGDVVSSTVPTSKIVAASQPFIVRDDAFLGLTPNRFAYKLDAKTISLRVGDSYSLASNQGIDGSLSYYDTSADGDNDYTGLIVNLNYLYRF